MSRVLPRRAIWVRGAPFGWFMLILALRSLLPEQLLQSFDARWLYALQAGGAALLLWWWRAEYGELARQLLPDARELLLAVATGVVVFLLWIQLDAPWMMLGPADAGFVPVSATGQLQWELIVVRLAGAALLVPLMEEIFWRSFLMRWVHRPRFEGVLPGEVGPRAIVVSVFIFTLAHPLWLAAIVAALAYTWLYMRTGKLWTAVISHAVTNGVLGVWVVATRNWQFW